MIYFSPVIAFLASLLLIGAMRSSRFGRRIQDIPNERSLHSAPIPRIGGVGLMAGLLSGWALMYSVVAWWLVLPVLALFLISLLDDMYGLPVRTRLLTHVAAAAILMGGSGLFASHGSVVALAVLMFTVWMTNLYNFMDGSDGLAGGMTLFGFSFYGLAALFAHNETLAMLNLAISSATLGFLYFNFPPAKVFMGDAGSIPLGFLAAAMGLWGWQQGCWPAWFPTFVFSPFIADASVTLARRTWRGEKITEAHRDHYYQRAIQLGWNHRKVALIEYALMFGVGTTSLFVMGEKLPWTSFLVWAGLYAVLMMLVEIAWRRFKRGQDAES